MGRTGFAARAAARAFLDALAITMAMAMAQTAAAVRSAQRIVGVMKVAPIPRPPRRACVVLCLQMSRSPHVGPPTARIIARPRPRPLVGATAGGVTVDS